MRLAVFTNQFPSTVNTFFSRDMRGLIAAGIEVDIFAIYPLDAGLWQHVPDMLNTAVLPRQRVHHLGFLDCITGSRRWRAREVFLLAREAPRIIISAIRFGFNPLVKSVYVMPKALTWAAMHAKAYDHVLAYWGNYAATCAYLFSRLQPAPFSLFLHAGTDLYRDQVFLLEKLRAAEKIIVVCEFNRQFLKDLYPLDFEGFGHKIHLHYIGLDLEKFLFTPDGRLPNRIVGVGRLSKEKGFAVLLKALALLKGRGVGVHCCLYGEGPERKSLERLARTLKLGSQVQLKGWLPFEEVRRAMGEATVLVHPSPYIGDSTTSVAKEALAVGLPVVASDIAGIPEVLNHGKCGILVPPGDVEALAQAIAALLSDNSLRRSFAEAGRRYAEDKFDMWKSGRALADILKNSSPGHRD